MFLGGKATYLQLQTEGNPEYLKSLHLKIHPYGRFVVLIKRTFAEPYRNQEKREGEKLCQGFNQQLLWSISSSINTSNIFLLISY